MQKKHTPFLGNPKWWHHQSQENRQLHGDERQPKETSHLRCLTNSDRLQSLVPAVLESSPAVLDIEYTHIRYHRVYQVSPCLSGITVHHASANAPGGSNCSIHLFCSGSAIQRAMKDLWQRFSFTPEQGFTSIFLVPLAPCAPFAVASNNNYHANYGVQFAPFDSQKDTSILCLQMDSWNLTG